MLKEMKLIFFFFSYPFFFFQTLFLVMFVNQIGYCFKHFRSTFLSSNLLESHEKASKKINHGVLYKNTIPGEKAWGNDESICNAFSHCSTCTKNSNCRFCVLKDFNTSQFLPYTEKTLGLVEKKALKGYCLSLKSTRWDKAFINDSTLKETAYCGLILPDYYNGITCTDINEGSQYKTYRETLEQIRPYFIATHFYDVGTDMTLEEALKKSGDPSGIASPNQGVFLIFLIISIISFFFGLLVFSIFSCCRACLRPCCCCCSCCFKSK